MSPLPFSRRDGDDALARRVARGDQAACSALFHRYHPRLELYCRSITRNDADAQDAAQSALTKAFAALAARPPETALRPWLFRIAHNEAISVLRRRRPEGEIAPELEHPQAGPAQTVELHEELRAVLADVRELPPRARQALLLRELADLDYGAVGGVLGISAGGARQAVFEARLALQADRAGREAPCEGIRQELSDCDARRRPTRVARGHLRGCSACRSWRQAQVQRRRSFALVPGVAGAGGVWAWAGLAGGGAASGGLATTTTGVGAKVAVGLAALAAGSAPVALELERGPAPATATAAAPKRTTTSSSARATPLPPAGTATLERVAATVAPGVVARRAAGRAATVARTAAARARDAAAEHRSRAERHGRRDADGAEEAADDERDADAVTDRPARGGHDGAPDDGARQPDVPGDTATVADAPVATPTAARSGREAGRRWGGSGARSSAARPTPTDGSGSGVSGGGGAQTAAPVVSSGSGSGSGFGPGSGSDSGSGSGSGSGTADGAGPSGDDATAPAAALPGDTRRAGP